jgi:hypothetical protein
MTEAASRRHRALFQSLGLLLVAMAVIPGAAQAAPDRKVYTVTVSPSSVGAGQTLGFTFTARNDSGSQSLGSINLTAPLDFTLMGDPGQPTRLSDGASIGTATRVGTTLIELRNLSLPPSDTVTFTFTAQAPCMQSGAAGADTWGLAAKQSNDFKGTGNDFAPSSSSQRTTDVMGSCQLDWLTQPASAEVGASITATPYDAADGSVGPLFIRAQVLSAPYADLSRSRVTRSTVRVTLAIEDDPNEPEASAPLGGTVQADAVAGVATFNPGPDIGLHGLDFTLSAGSPNMDTGESTTFDISDAVGECSKNNECRNLETHGANVSAKLNSTSAVGIIALSVGVLDGLVCPGYTPHDQQQAVTIFPLGVDASSTMTVEITIAAGIVDRPASQYLVCWASTQPFTQRDGSPAVSTTIAGESMFRGLLSDCAQRSPAPPCQITPSKQDKRGNVILKVFAPGNDPHAR